MENTFQKVIFQLEINSEFILNALFVNLDKAMEHVFGFTAANDVSGRDWQMKRNGGQWLLGKARISLTVVQVRSHIGHVIMDFELNNSVFLFRLLILFCH